jgi:uncharacterized protein (DUF342 family)
MASNKLTVMAHELRELKDRKQAISEEQKTINKRLKILTETEMPEYMEEQEIDKVTIDGVGTIYVQVQVYSNVKAEDRPAFYEWLKETGNEDMITEWVFPQSVNSFCKEQLENGKPVPDMVSAHKVPTAMLRRK